MTFPSFLCNTMWHFKFSVNYFIFFSLILNFVIGNWAHMGHQVFPDVMTHSYCYDTQYECIIMSVNFILVMLV